MAAAGFRIARLVANDSARVVLLHHDENGRTVAHTATVDGAEFADLPELLGAVDGDLDMVTPGSRVEISRSRILSVVGRPAKVICVGLNYRTHLAESGRPLPQHPELFVKFASTLTDPFEDINLPLSTSRVDWEAEIAFVIARRCRSVAQPDAASVVLGYTAANDVSVRDFQVRGTQWTAGKIWDESTPLGPSLVPAAQVGGVTPDLALTGRLNDKVVQQARSSDLLFGVADLVSYITTFLTLEPGDVVLTGTPGGIGAAMAPPVFLRENDIFEVEVEQVGTLRNRFRDHPTPQH